MEAETLPPWCYTSREFYELEVERIFKRSWNFVGRADMVPNPGDYVTVDLVGYAVIVLRDRAGQIHAFANSCRHRGTRLLSGEGSCKAIVCPYHSWSYDLEGSLIGSAGMEKTKDFNKDDFGLVPVELQSWGGFLFIRFANDDEDLLGYLGDFVEEFASYNFDEMLCTRRKTYELACNWKTYLENQREGYHVSTVHRESLGFQSAEQLETRGNWSGGFFRKPGTEATLRGETSAFPAIPTLRGRPAEGTHFVSIYPSTFMALTADCAWWIECRPQGPEHTTIVVGSCFPKTTVARPDFQSEVQKYYKRWDMTHPEDNAICELQQKGLSSPLARPGRLSHREAGIHAIDNWILNRVFGAAT